MGNQPCPECRKVSSGDCGQHGSATWSWSGPAIIPPAVCPGSGTIATDLQGMRAMSKIPTEGNCGICKQRVGVDGYQRCVVHAYKVPAIVESDERLQDPK